MWISDREQVCTSYRPSNLAFGWIVQPQPDANGVTSIIYWETCRERFLANQDGKRVFYFVHGLPRGRGRSIAVFIEKIEKKLGIKSIRRTKFQATSKRNIVKIMVAPFWDQTEIRRSLFSALLRAAANYRIWQDNFEEALYSTHYTDHTRRAVDRFLNDRAVHYYGDRYNDGIGWCNVFDGASLKRIRRLLQKKKKTK